MGALFKIQHWPGGGTILTIGLVTEAVLFLMFAFAPQAHDWDWSKVYPQLGSDWEGDDEEIVQPSNKPGVSASASLDKMFDRANIDQTMIDKLGKGMSNLSESVTKIGELGNASVATSEYAKNVKTASQSLMQMNKSYAGVVGSMTEMGKVATDVQQYSQQLQGVTKNLNQLNAVYEMELKDANNHLKSMNKFYSNLASAMENMTEANKDTQQFRSEMSKLNGNLTSLNNVYGGMLSAMKGTPQKA